MAEVTYVSEVECDVVIPNGMMDSQVVRVLDFESRSHALRVAKGELVEAGGKHYLPVGLVRVEREQKRAMVEFPQEADSGTRRVWVPFTRFRRQEGGA